MPPWIVPLLLTVTAPLAVPVNATPAASLPRMVPLFVRRLMALAVMPVVPPVIVPLPATALSAVLLTVVRVPRLKIPWLSCETIRPLLLKLLL